MKTSMIVMLLLAAVGVGNAWADRDHGHFDAHFGVMIGPGWGPGWPGFPSPYAYYPPAFPPVLLAPPAAPPVYIERQQAPAAAPSDYWYYCAEAKTYYPYVKECPGGWQKVVPQPPDQLRDESGAP